MLGFIAGLLLAILVVLLDIYLYIRKVSIVERVIEKVDKQISKKAVILQPPTPAQDALDEIIARNEELGQDTKLSDYL